MELSTRDRESIIPSNITIQILPKRVGNMSRTTIQRANIPCSKYNKSKLWVKVKPTGYFYNNSWILIHCKGIQHFSGECLRNKTILLWGDSTLHQWYLFIKKHLQAESEHACTWSMGNWRYPETCNFYKYNITISFQGHNIPISIYTKKNLYNVFKINSFEKFINSKSGKNRNLVLVLHLYAHLQQYNHNFFSAHILEIRKGLERIFKREPNIKVFIKLPHAYRKVEDRKWKLRRNDYIGVVFTNILRNTFKGLFNRITVLDQKDATIAERNLDLHPSKTIVREMVYQFISYACEDDPY
ncbi:NXPE family member 2-like [Ruditapes philippinarum]|uniref:NXPE family member 2-like n=1 Tax=Ruditapes philippinarum TaxID=129788 RepID=UPI00295C01B8|nr:NXPE family member 2-like [Ruditapes philippinarum]